MRRVRIIALNRSDTKLRTLDTTTTVIHICSHALLEPNIVELDTRSGGMDMGLGECVGSSVGANAAATQLKYQCRTRVEKLKTGIQESGKREREDSGWLNGGNRGGLPLQLLEEWSVEEADWFD